MGHYRMKAINILLKPTPVIIVPKLSTNTNCLLPLSLMDVFIYLLPKWNKFSFFFYFNRWPTQCFAILNLIPIFRGIYHSLSIQFSSRSTYNGYSTSHTFDLVFHIFIVKIRAGILLFLPKIPNLPYRFINHILPCLIRLTKSEFRIKFIQSAQLVWLHLGYN